MLYDINKTEFIRNLLKFNKLDKIFAFSSSVISVHSCISKSEGNNMMAAESTGELQPNM